MPTAVLHILVPLILMAIFKDIYEYKDKKRFPLHYVLIAGIAGVLPDIDIVAFWFLHFSGFTLNQIHRTFAHTIFIPIIFFALFLIFQKINIRELGRHKLKLSTIFLMISFGSLIHLLLDATFSGSIIPFYPFLDLKVGLNFIGLFPNPLNSLFIPSLEAGILVIWLIWLEWKHKISDFI